MPDTAARNARNVRRGWGGGWGAQRRKKEGGALQDAATSFGAQNRMRR